MVNTSFFNESQVQFNESQKKFMDLWAASQQQLSESQKKLFQTWIDSFPGKADPADFSQSAEKALNFQRELVKSTLNAQQVVTQYSIETQKQFWDNYFQMAQTMMQATPNR